MPTCFRFSFDTFSHRKAIVIRDYNPIGELCGMPRYPPYSEAKIKILNWYIFFTLCTVDDHDKLASKLSFFSSRIVKHRRLPDVWLLLKYLMLVIFGASITVGFKAAAKALGRDVPEWL